MKNQLIQTLAFANEQGFGDIEKILVTKLAEEFRITVKTYDGELGKYNTPALEKLQGSAIEWIKEFRSLVKDCGLKEAKEEYDRRYK